MFFSNLTTKSATALIILSWRKLSTLLATSLLDGGVKTPRSSLSETCSWKTSSSILIAGNLNSTKHCQRTYPKTVIGSRVLWGLSLCIATDHSCPIDSLVSYKPDSHWHDRELGAAIESTRAHTEGVHRRLVSCTTVMHWTTELLPSLTWRVCSKWVLLDLHPTCDGLGINAVAQVCWRMHMRAGNFSQMLSRVHPVASSI